MSELPLLAIAALFAGFIDAVAGGGGLIQVPALFNALPNESAATIFGTNKGASIVGTGNAAWRYARRIEIPWKLAFVAASAAFAFSFLGAMTVAWLPKAVVRPMVLVLMITVVLYTAFKPDFGRVQRKSKVTGHETPWAVVIGAALGFYDGLFGPVAGSFMIFAFIGIFGLDFLRASAVAKVVNLSTNAAALSYFVPTGHLLITVTLTMAVFNVAGAYVGTRLALRHGSTFVRGVFLAVSTVLIGKFGYDTLFSQIQ